MLYVQKIKRKWNEEKMLNANEKKFPRFTALSTFIFLLSLLGCFKFTVTECFCYENWKEIYFYREKEELSVQLIAKLFGESLLLELL